MAVRGERARLAVLVTLLVTASGVDVAAAIALAAGLVVMRLPQRCP